MTSTFQRVAAGLVLGTCVLIHPALAHDPQQAWASATVRPAGIDIDMVLSMYPSQTLIDKDLKRPAMSPDNFDTYQPELQQAALTLFEVTDGGQPLKALSATVEMTEEADVEYRISYPAPHTGPLRFRITYLDRILQGFITTLYIEDKDGNSLAWDELSTERDWLEAPFTPSPAPSAHSSSAPSPASAPVPKSVSAPAASSQPVMSTGKIIQLGAMSMIADFGHLLFACGLLAASRRIRPAAAVVACFALGHSLSLDLATLTGAALSSRLVEPMIAGSVVLIGIDNLVRGAEPRGRWMTAFGFGLMHGLGFASALSQAMPDSGRRLPLAPLFSFNLGIELGLIAVTIGFLVALKGLRRLPSFARLGPPAVSSVVTVLGAYWLLHRTAFF